MFETMDWQQTAALAIVAVTAAVMLWRKFRRRRFDFKRDTPCGCAASEETGDQSSIVFRARKGERPQITVRMK
jgi:ABC-type nickel/cobalt efflux system permease component RcnA